MKKELWLIWKNPNSRRRYTVGILTQHVDKFIFKYNEQVVEEISEQGFDYFPGFNNIKETYASENLFPNILNRLPNSNRDDYEEILNSYGLNMNNTFFEILERTKGRLLTDNYEFIPPFNKNKIEFEVAGINHCKDFEKCRDILKIGDKLSLELEANNQYDNNAIMVIFTDKEKYKIGYVPRYYSEDLAKLLRKNIGYIAEINNIKIETLIKDESVSAKVELLFK